MIEITNNYNIVMDSTFIFKLVTEEMIGIS